MWTSSGHKRNTIYLLQCGAAVTHQFQRHIAQEAGPFPPRLFLERADRCAGNNHFPDFVGEPQDLGDCTPALIACITALNAASSGVKFVLLRIGDTRFRQQGSVNGDRFVAVRTVLAQQALRVLAVAQRIIPAHEFGPAGDLWHWADDWSLVGLAGLMDPPRPEAAAAIARCSSAGIQVKMITGDHKATASAIARELGLTGDVISGAELDATSEEELARRIPSISVFARVSPAHKVRIVRALKADGEVTAMTGDGVNDAPALKVADIGVAMGINGTAVTREAATMVLTDDNFATIVRAVEEGRVIYDNIVKFVRFQLSTNIGAILTVLAATLLGMPAPFTAIQLLWINIIMDGPPAMTLGLEPGRPGIMRDRPRQQQAQILTLARMGQLALYGITMMLGTLWLFRQGLADHGRSYALTLAFTTFVLFQVFNVFNARNEHGSAFNVHFLKNGKLWLALAGVLVLQAVAVHWTPAQRIFGTTDLHLGDWLSAVLIASSVLLLDEARKLLQRLLQRWRSTEPGSR